MIEINYSDIENDELMQGALIHDVHTGFKQDYLTLHYLLRKYRPKTIWETGTNVGSGINVMATALPEAKIFSLDLDYETMRLNSKQYPIGAKGEDRVGSAARFPYTQLRGDSKTFDYSKYPCEAAWVDGEHSEDFVRHETIQLLENGTNLIIYHDADILEVWTGILAGIYLGKSHNHVLHRVLGTRIAYLLKVKNEVTVKSELFEVLDLTAGGIVTGPNNAYFGDDSPEQIIPLDKLKDCIAKPKKARKKK